MQGTNGVAHWLKILADVDVLQPLENVDSWFDNGG